MTDSADPATVSTALAAFMEDRPQPVVVIGPDGALQYANRAATVRLSGDPEDDLVGRAAADLLAPVGATDDLLDAVGRAAGAGRSLSLRPTADDAEEPLSATVDAAADGWALSFQPVAAASPDDPAAADGPSLAAGDYRRALETAADGIAILDSDGRYRYVNPALAELYGYDCPESLVGQHWRHLYDEAEAERLAGDIIPILTDDREPWRGETVGRRRSGETFPQELALSPLPNGGLVCVVRDLTDQDRHERALEALREATRDLLAAADREVAATVAVETARRALDLPLSAVYLTDEGGDRLEPVAHSETVAEVFDEFPTFTGERESLVWRAYTTGELQRFSAEGATGAVYNRDSPAAGELVLPLGDHGALILGHLGERDLDAESVRLARTLAASLTTALDQVAATARLQRKNDQLERLSSVLSHDLRDPLNTAMATTTLARAVADGEVDERLAELEAVHARMETLIEGVLALARGGDDIDPEPVALAPLAREAWRTARRGTDADGATLTVAVSGTVTADRPHLGRLLENLFANAVRHAGPEVAVTVGGTESGFYVADDGPGIPPDERDRVFERGYTTGDGTGLGLDIVRVVAEGHGWSVSVGESRVGGARFDIEGVRRPPAQE